METLNEEQRNIADDLLKNRHNAFITGNAGTGKSYLLRVLVEEFRKRNRNVAVTAMTGLAALNIDGSTLHSFMGLGLDGKGKMSSSLKNKLFETKVLIIDEISMLDIEYFRNIYKYLKTIQVIVFGDFLQLPPINGEYCFTSAEWSSMGFDRYTYRLRTIVRQKNKNFITVLNNVRQNKIGDTTIKYLRKLCITNKKIEDDSKYTKLYTMNRDVDFENTKKLNELHGDMISLVALDEYVPIDIPHDIKSKLLDKANREVLGSIEIKIGAKVMLSRNDSGKRYVNGSIGTIDKVVKENNIITTVYVKLSENVVCAIERIDYKFSYKVGSKEYILTRMQYPLKLAYALTIHKSQGLTLEYVMLSVKGAFENGQCYTGMSRCSSPDNLVIDDVESLIRYNKVSKIALATDR